MHRFAGFTVVVALIVSLFVSQPALATEVIPDETEIPNTTIPANGLVTELTVTTSQTLDDTQETIDVTATVDAPVELTNDQITIFNEEDNIVQTCVTGVVCTFEYETVDYAPDVTFYAKTTNLTSTLVQVLNQTPTISLSVDFTVASSWEYYTLTLDRAGSLPVGASYYIVEVESGDVVKTCSDFTVNCQLVDNFWDAADLKSYIAYVADEDDSWSLNFSDLTGIVATSNTIQVTREPWVVSLAADTPFAEDADNFGVEARVNQIIPEGLALHIYNETSNKFLVGESPRWCLESLEHKECGTSLGFDSTGTYVAYLAAVDEDLTETSTVEDLQDIRAVSNKFIVKKLPWNLQLKSKIAMPGEPGVAFIGTVNQKMWYYQDAIIENGTNKILELCDSYEDDCEAYGEAYRQGYPSLTAPIANGVSYVIGRWSEGRDTDFEPNGYMYDIQASISLINFTPTPVSPLKLNNPHSTTGGSNPSEACPQTCVADPINTVTGEFWLEETDLTINSSIPLNLNRYYSVSKRGIMGSMGYGWSTGYDMKLSPVDTTSLTTASAVNVTQENGAVTTFTKNIVGEWETNIQTKATLTEDTNGFLFTRNKETFFNFNTTGKLTTIKDLNDNTIALAYNTAGQLSTVTNGKAQTLTLTWVSNKISTVSDGLKIVTYTYNAKNELTGVTFPDLGKHTYTYDSTHAILKFTDPKNNGTVNVYDDQKRVIKQTDPLLNETVIGYQFGNTKITQPNDREDVHYYNELGQVTYVKTGDSYSESYEFNAMNNLTKIIYPDGGTIQRNYDVDGNLLEEKDRAGNITSYTYNDLNRPLMVTNPNTETSSYSYDMKGNLTGFTDYNGNTTTHVINSDGTIQNTTLPNTGVTNYTYNLNGLVATTTKPNTGMNTVTYNTVGNPLNSTDELGNVTTYVYNNMGWVSEITHPNTGKTTYTYDKNGNILTTKNPLNNTLTYTYDKLDRVLTEKDAKNKTVKTSYDVMGNVFNTTDQLNNVTEYEYDERNNQISREDPNYGWVTYDYNKIGQLTQMNDSRNGGVTKYRYDANGNLTQTINPEGVQTKTSYNNLNLPIKTVDVQGKDTTYTYDANGNLLTTTYPDLTVETNTYNATNQVIQLTDTAGGVKQWEYNTTGFTTKFINTNNDITLYGYDLVGNLTTNTRPDTSVVTHEYTYNQLDKTIYSDAVIEYEYNLSGVRTKEKQGTSIVNYVYDVNGNVTSRGPPTSQVNYTYTARNQVAKLTYPSGNTIDYTYDKMGNTVSAVSSETGEYSYEYNENNTIAEAVNPNDTIQTFEHNKINGITGLAIEGNDGELFNKEYVYNERSGLLSSTNTTGEENSVNETYAYDNRTRLAGVVASDNTLVAGGDYTYNPVGNLTGNLGDAQTYNMGNQLTNTLTASHSLDGRGNRVTTTISTALTEYEYNQADKLTTYETNTEQVEYTYDANGLLSKRTEDNQTDSFVWDYTNSVPLLLDDGKYEYIYTVSNSPVAQINKDTDEITYLHADAIGSIVIASDDTGEQVAYYNYNAYGELNKIWSTDDNKTVTRFGYVGEWEDPTTGQYNLRARWYETGSATFLTRDPLEQSTGEAYSYASGNPLLYVDPLGKDAEEYSSYEINWDMEGAVAIPFLLSLTNYGYKYEWVVGDASKITATEAMSIFQNNPSEIFPFDVQGCATLSNGETCNLAALSHHEEFSNDVDWPIIDFANDGVRNLSKHQGTVAVTSTCTSTVFTVSKPGYFDPVGSTISFKTRKENGKIIFSQETYVQGVWFPAGFGVNVRKQAKNTWEQQADNLERMVNGT